MNTPCYLFEPEKFRKRTELIKSFFTEEELTFSVKANPFLTAFLPDSALIRHVEVCSPGELSICKKTGICGDRIIYSGVMKEETDIHDAVSYGAGILTAESKRHYELICAESVRSGQSVNVLLRLSSGNQFGMSNEDILDILSGDDHRSVNIIGIHYYSGTAKNRLKQIEKDIEALTGLLSDAEKSCGFVPSLVEYGPGLAAEYYEAPYDEKDLALLKMVSDPIKNFGKKYRLGIEMGRFMAADCGSYHTTVKDIKKTGGVNYVIVDGGIHQLKYYGQNMAMKVPPVSVMRDGGIPDASSGKENYCICGSLCTVADVLVREIELPVLNIGDTLCFGRTGAYSVTEGPLSFLSRNLPEIWVRDGGLKLLRGETESWKLNSVEDK